MKATNYSHCKLEFLAPSTLGEWAYRIGGEGGRRSMYFFLVDEST